MVRTRGAPSRPRWSQWRRVWHVCSDLSPFLRLSLNIVLKGLTHKAPYLLHLAVTHIIYGCQDEDVRYIG